MTNIFIKNKSATIVPGLSESEIVSLNERNCFSSFWITCSGLLKFFKTHLVIKVRIQKQNLDADLIRIRRNNEIVERNIKVTFFTAIFQNIFSLVSNLRLAESPFTNSVLTWYVWCRSCRLSETIAPNLCRSPQRLHEQQRLATGELRNLGLL